LERFRYVYLSTTQSLLEPLIIHAGAFVAAPFGGLLWAFGACAIRIGFLWVLAKVRGHRFDALDRPVPRNVERPGAFDEQENDAVLEHSSVDTRPGKFF
jgi:hypothetical protein